MGAAASAVITALLYVLLPSVASEVNQGWGTNIRQRAETLAKQIYTKLMKNQKTKEMLQDAYANKNNDLLSSLVNQSGYALQASALRKAIAEERAKYKKENSDLVDQGTELTNQYNKVLNAGNTAGTSIAANNAAEKSLKEINQLVNGGSE